MRTIKRNARIGSGLNSDFVKNENSSSNESESERFCEFTKLGINELLKILFLCEWLNKLSKNYEYTYT